jgi:hypothetical protein
VKLSNVNGKALECVFTKKPLKPYTEKVTSHRPAALFQTIALLAGTMVIIEPELSQKMMRQMNTIHSKKALYQV